MPSKKLRPVQKSAPGLNILKCSMMPQWHKEKHFKIKFQVCIATRLGSGVIDTSREQH